MRNKAVKTEPTVRSGNGTIRSFSVLCAVVFTTACVKNHAPSVCEDAVPLHKAMPFPLGTCIDLRSLRINQQYRALAEDEFESITPELVFKADRIHPSQFLYDFTGADELVAFCAENNKRLHGHTLVWHEQLPSWIQTFPGNAGEWEALLRDHIQTVVSHFKGKTKAWDVVNEAFNDDGTLRNTVWFRNVGPAYIEKAFRYAAEADPEALLFYNDYSLELNPKKRKAVISFLNNLRMRGVKIDGIGLQMHVNIYFPEPSQVAEALKEVQAAGYLVHLSELDVSLYLKPPLSQISVSQHLLNRQASTAASIIRHYLELPDTLKYGVTFWGVADPHTWLNSRYGVKDYPLLFDDHYQAKPMYMECKKILCE